MSSPGGVKGHRQAQSLSKSTLTGESRQEKGDTKTCLFCGFIDRDDHEKIQVREVAQRSLESGQVDDVIDVEKFGKDLTRLAMGSHVHSRRSGKERRWTCNGSKLLCLLDFR